MAKSQLIEDAEKVIKREIIGAMVALDNMRIPTSSKDYHIEYQKILDRHAHKIIVAVKKDIRKEMANDK